MDLSSPLTTQEEIRLSTAGNFITLALFRPLDTFKCAAKKSGQQGSVAFAHLWRGWPRQALNKAVDDEIFNANIQRVSSFVQENFNIKEPAGTPGGKAAVAVLARALTLGFMVPYHTLQDPVKRKIALSKTGAASKSLLLPIIPLYRGFERSLAKESIFTASYVLSSAYFGNFFGRYRQHIAGYVKRVCPEARKDEKKEKKYTDVAVASLKAASAGALASVLSAPVDMLGAKIPVQKQVTTITRKAFRKGCYNGINTIIVQSLYSTKIHRRLLQNLIVKTPESLRHTEATEAAAKQA